MAANGGVWFWAGLWVESEDSGGGALEERREWKSLSTGLRVRAALEKVVEFLLREATGV